MTNSARRLRGVADPSSARASCLRWVQQWHQHGSELRLSLEEALIEFDPRAFIIALDRMESQLSPGHYRTGRKLGMRWQRLVEAG